MKRVMTLTVAVLLAGLSVTRADNDASPSQSLQPVLEAEAARIAVMEKAKDAVLAVFASTGQGGGSGVVITPDGYALTNFHVVKPCGNAMKCGMADGQVFDAVVVGLDPTGDVGLIKLFGRDDFPHAELGDSDRLGVGDWCFAMGNPFLLATDFQPTVTYGIISGVHRYQFPAGTLLEYADCIQTDASINPGNSGGPLFDAAGLLIGINGRGSFEKRGRVNVGVAYAISINQIKNFLGYLRSGRIVDHATLGAQVISDEDGRVTVSDILEESDAYRRGLRYGDEIVSFGGRSISTPNGFKNVLGIYPNRWRVPLSYRREGERFDVLVRLSGVHGTEELIKKSQGGPQRPPMPIPEPGDEDEKDKKKPKSGDKPKIEPHRIPVPGPGDPRHHPMIRPKPPMPEVVKKHFEAKRGYANYFFNKLNRRRVWEAWTARGDFGDFDGTWTFSGELAGGRAFRFEITDTGVVLDLPTREFKWTAGDDFSASPAATQSGGLLPALYLWRRLAVVGPERFGDVTYQGTVPLAGHEGLVDAVVGLHKGVECRFLFDPAEGNLLALEMFLAEDVDPCEIYFPEYRESDGRFLPARMDVRVGDDPYGDFSIDQIKLDKAGEAREESAEEKSP